MQGGIAGLIIGSILVLTLQGCSDKSEKIEGLNGDLDLKIYSVRGVPLECAKIGTLRTCNWGKYNAIAAECKKESLERRTTEKGLVFPAVKGECQQKEEIQPDKSTKN